MPHAHGISENPPNGSCQQYDPSQEGWVHNMVTTGMSSNHLNDLTRIHINLGTMYYLVILASRELHHLL
jgi:hypothetical protein